MSAPVLFIIAGPNGSGKSLFSKRLTTYDLEVFDGDKHMAALIKKYPETGSEALWSFINENIFESQKREVLASRRVEYRVHKGGHKVSEESIRYNYESGFKNLYKYVTEFDLVTLFDNKIALIEESLIPQEILHIKKGKVYLQIENYPAWVEPIIARLQAGL